MQPLLLLKQTLECSYDPGALLLDGPNVKFTSSDQLLTLYGKEKQNKFFSVGVSTSLGGSFYSTLERKPGEALDLKQTRYDTNDGSLIVNKCDNDDTNPCLSTIIKVNQWIEGFEKNFPVSGFRITSVRQRCFLKPAHTSKNKHIKF